MSATEHILLESDVREVPHIRAARKVHARVRLKSRLRRRVMQLEIIDYYFLAVRSWHSGILLAEYVVDLRFVEAAPRISRRFIVWETISLHSAHGNAKCLEFTGGIGTLRAARLFLTRLVAHTRLAMAARRRSRAAHLRDEMREHFRLKEIGTLTPDEYEAAKVRILGQHAR